MPSFDTARLHAMAEHMRAALASEDWARLGQLDSLVQRWLQEAAQGGRHEAHASAWQQLAQVHDQALQACCQARAASAEQLRSLQLSQEAQKAYAWQEILA